MTRRDDDEAVGKGPGAPWVVPLLAIGVLAIVGYGLIASRTIFSPDEEHVELVPEQLQRRARGDDAEAVRLLAVTALFELKGLTVESSGEGVPRKVFDWSRWPPEARREAYDLLERTAGFDVVRGMVQGYDACAGQAAADRERACVQEMARYTSANLARLLDKHVASGTWQREEVVGALGHLAGREPLMAKAIATGFVPMLRVLDARGNGSATAYVVGTAEPLAEHGELFETLLALKLGPAAGGTPTLARCRFTSGDYDYPAGCMGDRDVDADFEATTGRGRYHFGSLVRRVLGHARMMKALGKTEAARAYLEALGFKETAARAYGGDVKPLGAVDEATLTEYLARLKETTENLVKSNMCRETPMEAPGGEALAAGETFMTPSGQTRPGGDVVRLTVRNDVTLGIDAGQVPAGVGRVSVIVLNGQDARESFARQLEMGDAATVDLPPGRYTIIRELADIVLPNFTTSGFCRLTRTELKAGTYVERVALQR